LGAGVVESAQAFERKKREGFMSPGGEAGEGEFFAGGEIGEIGLAVEDGLHEAFGLGGVEGPGG